jgi:serine/threonine protein kinase/Flp pilus assembly protein TadD
MPRAVPASGESDCRSATGDPGSSWLSRQVDALAAAWACGERKLADEILAERPGIEDEAAIRLIYEEVCLRRESGQDVATSEIVGRFPRFKDQLEILLGCDRLLRPLSRPAVLPELGEQLGPFRLIAELGRGASGRTYLAAEPALADRLVVLKVIPDDQEEHLSLARLQHTNIIPLFSEQTFADLGLRALCMPYLGGTSLARLMDSLSEIAPAARRGSDLLAVLDRVQDGRPDPPKLDGPFRRFLERASYTRAVCGIVACLADALEFAHARRLVHMDVKPSNVLITADGTPMLLDFHLARRPVRPGEPLPDRFGGTPGWMAPEHRLALDAVALGQHVSQPVDERADLYALGLLLREALGGPGPWADDRAGRQLCLRNPEVSAGLNDIVQKCLAERPTARYRQASELAEDLRLHINDLPLRSVSNRSLVERWQKWRRRPSASGRRIAWALCGVSIASLLAVSLLFYNQRLGELRRALEDGREFCRSDRFQDAIYTLSRALDRGVMVPGAGELSRAVSQELRKARRGRDAAELHRLADLVRFQYGLTLPAASEANALLHDIRTIWNRRDLLIAPRAGTLEPQLEQQIRGDLLELVAFWAELRTGRAAPEEAREDALRLVEEARAACGPSFTIDRLRLSLAQLDGRLDAATESPVPRTARDHYELGRFFLRRGDFSAAAREFQQTLDERPQDFWPNFYQGVCAYRLRQLPDALAAFSISIALHPARADCYYNRGMAYDASGRLDQAFRDYSHAIGLNPALVAARINRGILSYRAARHADSIADFEQALRLSSDPQTLSSIHYNLALAHNAHGDRAAALASAKEALAGGCQEARSLLARLGPES